ncbi:HEAT repeat-containing protein [Cavenderia fasciculata]|uniref:HEAT repeat-containing protein n=1 Tax=Cavenderia fasciculata TaxID=261658 RepID=F4PKF0_CACFS|nr:HEAT repeat-containing protein [Cavenderia fasciculata]EGG24074.1 HEAT repeat-containing protein [Cavenderia fasciculata]|eukprot:XP_004361925.1 HEAT repeat-containing protein [Cavenderia fasciculata]
MASFFLTQVLEKMGSRDKDIRFMATHDLANEMEKESFKMDPLMEPKIVQKLLTLVDDNANNVQENVVKCLGLLIKIVKDQIAQEIADSLIKGLLESEKEDLHEISSIGLKTIIGNMTPDSTIATLVTKRVAPKMLEGISASKPGDKTEVKMYCLDILNYLLVKYGSLVPNLDQVRDVVLPNLSATRPATRKRAINCLASFAIPASDDLFYGLMDNITKQIDEAKKGDHVSTLVQLIGQIGRSSGYRLGKYLPKIMQHILKNVENSKFESDELKENCLLCFESIVEKCQKDVSPYLNDIITLSLKYIKFDPNYEDDEDEENDEMETDDEDEEEEEDEDDGDVDDDDDISWKIRRSAAKTLAAVITHRPEILLSLSETVAPTLIGRFREREENVRLEIFTTYVLLLKQTNKKNVDLKSIGVLHQQVPKMIASIKKPLNDKSIKTRVGAFQLLKVTMELLKPQLSAAEITIFVKAIGSALVEKSNNSNLKIEALSFLRVLLATQQADGFQPHIKVLSVHIVKCVRESYYRVSSEALRVCQEFVTVLRAADKQAKPDLSIVNEIFEGTLQQLKAQDIDQEVKESAISCMGIIISVFGDVLSAQQLQPCLSILFLDRLENEITRVVALKAISKIITSSSTQIDLSSVISKTIDLLTTFLRKNNRSLKQNTIQTFVDIATHIPNSITASQLPSILTELSSNISESDLQLTNLSFVFYKQLLATHASSIKLFKEKLLPSILALLKSSVLQGVALESLLQLLADVVPKKEAGVTFGDLLAALFDAASQIKQPATRQSIAAISQCIAVITIASGDQIKPTVEKLIKNLSSNDDSLVLLSLTTIGEIGRRTNLSSVSSTIQNDIFKTFDASNEEVKQVAALSLGNIAVAALATYVPFILDNIRSQPKKQYLLLHSLKELIVKLTAAGTIAQILPFLPTILPLLFENSTNEEEGTRNLVAECLGKLAMVDPKNIIPQLEAKIGTNSPFAEATVVTSIKFAILESKNGLATDYLEPIVTRFLALLNNPDLVVKRAALLTLNYISHNRPALIRGNLPVYLPILYNNCRIKPELIREVDLGPFKHKVDDGIEIRKTAFECMYTLLDTSGDKIDMAPFIESIAAGLKDTQHDIKLLCHLLIVRLSMVSGQALLEGLSSLVDPFKTTLLAKVADQTVKQQVERNEECIRSALRAIASIHRIPSSESIVKFEEFVRTTIRQNQKLNTTFNTILEEDQSIHDEKMDTGSD